MSKIIASAAIRGANTLYKEAKTFWDKAVKEKGPDQEVGFLVECIRGSEADAKN